MPRVHLHIFETPATHESRFLKEAEAALRDNLADEVVLLAREAPGLMREECPSPGIRILRLPLRSRRLPANKALALIKIAEAHWRFIRAGLALRPSLVHCHSLPPLSAAVALRGRLRVPLVYDAHELETEKCGFRGLRQRVARFQERHHIGHCDAVLCVSDGIADWYRDVYSIPRPAVVRNIPDVGIQAEFEGSRILRDRFSLGPEDLIFLYQGGLFRGRRIESILEAWEGVGAGRHLVFMGYGELADRVRAAAARNPTIHYLAAVPPREVLRYTASADVGLCGVENACLSYYHCLPNKFFEFLHAGIGCLAPDFPELRRVILDIGCGWLVGESVAEWREVIRSLTPEAIRMAKLRVLESKGRYSWRAEEGVLLGVYRRLLGGIQRDL